MQTIPGPLLWEELVPGGCHWSGVVRRGVALRLTDLSGGANCAMLLFNHEERHERYNMPDTLKAQHTAFLTQGHVLQTDMGRVICSVIEDSCGWHDTICGVMDDKTLAERLGERRYQEHRNDMHRSGKEGLLKELGRVDLGKRDLHANANWFSKVSADETGKLYFVPNHSAPGSYVDLRFDMHAFVALSICMHPLDPRPRWDPRPVKISAWRCGVAGTEDPCRNSCPENQRAFINTERYYAQ
ncbi:MAG: urea amidolyase associated protein UAAP1 [Burkholderiales bacterium]